MKNAVISALLTYIFYTDFAEVKIPWLIPIIFGLVWLILEGIEEDLINDYLKRLRRGRRALRGIRQTLKRSDRLSE